MRLPKIFLIVLFAFIQLSPVKKDAEGDVFATWMKIQHVFPQIDIRDMSKYINLDLLPKIKNKLSLHFNQIKTLSKFFSLFNNENSFIKFDFDEELVSNSIFKNNLKKIYETLHGDINEFIQFLISIGFSDSTMNCEEQDIGARLIIDKYNEVFEFLFSQKDYIKQYQFLFSVANKFYEYCFSPKTFSNFNHLISNDDNHPIARLMYTIIWYYLAGHGWKYWHQNSLDNLKKLSKEGYKFVYIAGGSDIYQLIKNGIYNIKIIDPLLPSQLKYYSEGCYWLWRGDGKNGGIGDELEFNFEDKKIVMKRVHFKEFDKTFKSSLSTGERVELAKSLTIWNVLDGRTNEKLGSVTIDRRFVNQDDFVLGPKEQLLISFNELHFITLPDSFDGWGINPYKFDENLSVIVKQLSSPVSAKMMQNMRKVIEDKKFRFTEFGTCVT